MHNALLAHAHAVDVFRKGGYRGRIGIKIDGTPGVPLDQSSKTDRDALQRANDFEVRARLIFLRRDWVFELCMSFVHADGMGRRATLHRYDNPLCISKDSQRIFFLSRIFSLQGDYPPIMHQVMGHHLPNFTSAESALLKGSADFVGFDAYTSQWISPTKGRCEYGDDTWPSW